MSSAICVDESAATRQQPPELLEIVGWHYVPWMLLRALAMVVFMAAGLAWLGFLHDATRGTGVLHLAEEPLLIVTRTLRLAASPMICLAMLGECVILLIVYFRLSDSWMQLVPPVAVGLLAGVLGWHLFPEPTLIAKQRLLVAGTMLATYLAVSVQVALWYMIHGRDRESETVPASWYILLLLLGAIFAGGAHGWLYAPHPMVNELLAAQAQHRAREQLLDAPGEQPLIIP